MPSSATITAFYNFTANTKARASQVQNNFDVFRGHLLPVHVSTSTALDNSYDLGSADYRYRDAYLGGNINVAGSMTLGGDISLRNYVHFGTATTNSITIEKANTATGEMNFKINGSTTVQLVSGGFKRNSLLPGLTFTSVVASLDWNTETSSTISQFSLTLNCSGRPVMYGLMGTGGTTGVSFNYSSVWLYPISSPSENFAFLHFFVNTTTNNPLNLYIYSPTSTSSTYDKPNAFVFIDPSPTPGSNTYFINGHVGDTATASLRFRYLKAFAYEMP